MGIVERSGVVDGSAVRPGDALIGIRSRAVEDRPLAAVSDTERATTKFLGTFGVPAALIIFGLVRAAARRRRKALAVRVGGL